MNKLPDEQLDTIVDDALSSYPLATPPESLLAGVMARLETQTVVPRFRLSWLDVAVSLIIAGGVGLLLFLWPFVYLLLPLFLTIVMPDNATLTYIGLSLAGGIISTVMVLLVTGLILPERPFEFQSLMLNNN